MSSARRIGPFTTTSGAGALVVADTPCRIERLVADRLDGGEHDGQVLGTAAGHHRVDGDLLDGGAPVIGRTSATSSSPARPLASTARSTRSRVGGTTGRPSVKPFS